MHNLDPRGGFGLFTDGSAWANDRSGGWAWVCYDAFDGECHGAGYVANTTNNRMEMQAWVEGLNAIHNVHGSAEVVVFSDSQYVGLGAMNPERNRHKNKDLWYELDTAIDQHEYVEFVHVKGHNNHHYNELADRLASHARRNGQEKFVSTP